MVEGYERRLDQGSPDHRGTPERLGRVATLRPAPGARCGGVVYRIAEQDEAEILTMLDVREQGGYERILIEAHTEEGAVRATTWIASADNPYHLGHAPIAQMAAQIREAVGPSGTNLEYVLALDEALRALGFADAHVAEVVAALRGRP